MKFKSFDSLLSDIDTEIFVHQISFITHRNRVVLLIFRRVLRRKIFTYSNTDKIQ